MARALTVRPASSRQIGGKVIFEPCGKVNVRLDTETIHGMIDDSYDLVVKGLSKAVREELKGK